MFKSRNIFLLPLAFLFIFLISFHTTNALTCGNIFAGNTFLQKIGVAPQQTVEALCVNLSSNVNTIPRGYTFKVIINTSVELKSFDVSNISVDGGTVKEIRKLSKTSYFAVINPAEDAKVVNVQIEAESLEDINGNRNDNASNEVIVRILIPVTTTNNSSSSTNNSSFISNLLDKLSSSLPTAPQCSYTVQGQLITGSNLNTSGCPTTNTQNTQQTQLYNCYGQQIPNTQPCPYDPYREAQQQQLLYQQQLQRQQLAQQQNQGLSGILSSLLSGKGFGGGNNSTGNPFSGQQIQQVLPSPAPTPQPAPVVESEADKLKKKLEACKDDACKTATQKEIDDAKSKADAEALEKTKETPAPAKEDPKPDEKKDTPTQNKTYSVVVKKLENCSAGRPYFCSKVVDEPTAQKLNLWPSFNHSKQNAYMFKKGSVSYAIVGDKSRLDLRKDECIVQDPMASPSFYYSGQGNKLTFAGCSNGITKYISSGDNDMCSEYPPVTSGAETQYLGTRVYVYEGKVPLKSAPCNK